MSRCSGDGSKRRVIPMGWMAHFRRGSVAVEKDKVDDLPGGRRATFKRRDEMPKVVKKAPARGVDERSPAPENHDAVLVAINVFDLDGLGSEVRKKLLVPRLHLDGAICVDRKGKDEHAVVFSCSALEAGTACDIVRSEDRRAGRPETRVYLGQKGRWTKVPSHLALTVVRNGATVLNPAVFRPAVRPEHLGAPSARPVRLGSRPPENGD